VALYYEDLSVGQTFTSPARTVTETDLVHFAMLSGDWNPIHTDKEFAQQTYYGAYSCCTQTMIYSSYS
jgi:acyl dehydratase